MPLPLIKAKRDAIQAIADAHVESIRAAMEAGKVGTRYTRLLKEAKVMGDAGSVDIDVHEYVSPEGAGWDVVLECTVGANKYTARLKGSGPESRAHDFTQLPAVR